MAEAFDPKQWLRDNPPPPQDPTAMPGTTMLPEEDPWSQRAQEMLRLSGNAFTFGMGDRARAVGQVLWGDGASGYSDALKQQTAESERIRAKNPGAAVGAELFGGLAQGAAAAPLGVAGRLGASIPWMTRAAVGAGEAGIYGAAQGAGNTYSGNPMDYVTNAGRNAAIAMPIGAAAPAVGAAASNVAGRYGHLRTPMEVIRGERPIPRMLGQAAEADRAGLTDMQTRMRGVPPPGGQQEMLPEAGPSMLGTTQGVALGGAPEASNLRGQITVRNQGSAPRVTQGLNETLGPGQVPRDIIHTINERLDQLGAQYERVLPNATGPVSTQPLQADLVRLVANRAGDARVEAARWLRELEIPGTGQLNPEPTAVHNVRTAVRARMRALQATEGADGEVIGVLGDINEALSARLRAVVPGLDKIDVGYRALHDQIRGVATGRDILRKGENPIWPQEVRREFGIDDPGIGHNRGPALDPPLPAVQRRITEGLRGKLEEVVGTNVNDLATLRRLIAEPQDFNHQKLITVFGPERANRLMDLLATEARMQNTYTSVVGNSLTAQRQAAEKAASEAEGKIPWDATFFGSAGRGLQEAYRAMTRSTTAGAKENMARILAERNPAEIDRLIDRLLAIAPRNTSRADIARLIATQGTIGAGAAAPQ